MPTWFYFDMFCNTSWYLIMLILQFGSFSWRLTLVFLVWCILQSTVSSVSLVAQMVKGLPAIWETWAWSLGWKDSLERKWQPTPVLWPGKSHGHRSLVGYSPWGCTKLDPTKQLQLSSCHCGPLCLPCGRIIHLLPCHGLMVSICWLWALLHGLTLLIGYWHI